MRLVGGTDREQTVKQLLFDNHNGQTEDTHNKPLKFAVSLPMATWLVHVPWPSPVRTRLRPDLVPSRLWRQARSHLNIALQTPSPASLEIERMPYPTAHPDASVFEPMSAEYASVSTPYADSFIPLSSSDTLASLVLKGNFQAAESLRKEMLSHQIPIPHDILYLQAALHAITERRPKGSVRERLDTFEAWLSLAPDRSEKPYSFYDIRQRLFRSMDHLNLQLVYRFGLVLASKGYCYGDAAIQVVSTLARYARSSVVKKYLLEVEDVSRDYYAKMGAVPPPGLLAGAYNFSINTAALSGKGQAALSLISMAHSRGIRVPDFTLDIAVKHATDRKTAMDYILTMYPSLRRQDANTHSSRLECEPIPVEHTADVAALATRLRSLRTALRSRCQPSPRALGSFLTSCRALGRTRTLSLLRSLACRHSSKSASTWAFAEMLHHRSRLEPIHLLFVFFHYFHLVGVPRKTLLSLIRGKRGKQAQEERLRRWVVSPQPMNEKLWPSAYHTALVWEAIVTLSPKTETKRLYALLLSLVRQSKRRDPEPAQDGQVPEADDSVRLKLTPDTFDAAHFSPFVSWWSRRSPAGASRVLRDMSDLGIAPTVVQWSMVARGYAQHDDPRVALRILNHLETTHGGAPHALLGIYTNVLRGFVVAGDAEHAREVERLLTDRRGYRIGDSPATDASIALLGELEGARWYAVPTWSRYCLALKGGLLLR